MIRVIPVEERDHRLKAIGVPDQFLRAVADPNSPFCREAQIVFPEATYDYYRMTPYIAERYGTGEVIPVCCSFASDPFYDCIIGDNGTVRFHANFLEHDGYPLGQSFSHMMFDIAIPFWENADHLSDHQVAEVLHNVGYQRAAEFVAALSNADRSSGEKAQAWASANIEQFT